VANKVVDHLLNLIEDGMYRTRRVASSTGAVHVGLEQGPTTTLRYQSDTE